MKKMLLGLAVLALLFCACLGNTVYIEMELSATKAFIQESLHKPEDEAYELISLAWKRYDSAQAYMNIVLRENRCDAINECFIELFEAPDNENCKNRLMHQLESALTAEKLRLGSVF